MNRRFALIQALVSLVALAAVVWWASKQEAPELPSGSTAIAWLSAALALYAVATLLRGERWHRILKATGVRGAPQRLLRAHHRGLHGQQRAARRAPGEMLRVVLLSRPLLGEQAHAARLGGRRAPARRDRAGRDLRRGGLRGAELHRAAHRPAAAVRRTDRAAGAAALPAASVVMRRHHVFERAATGCGRSPTLRAPCVGREGVVLLGATFVAVGRRGGRLPRRRPHASTSTSARWARSTWSR